MAKISEVTSGGAMVSTDAILALRSGANVRVTIGNMVAQSSSAVAITGGTVDGTVLGGITPAAIFSTGIGIGNGTTAPTATLDVRRADTDGKIAEFHQSTGYGLEFGSSQAQAYIQAGSNQTLLMTVPSDMTIDSGGDITLDVAGGDVRIKADGTQEMQFKITDGANVDIISTVADDDMRFRGNDGGATITALTLDMSEAGAATFAGNLRTSSGLSVAAGADYGSQQSFWADAGGGTHQAGYTIGWNTGSNDGRTQKMALDASGNLTVTGDIYTGGATAAYFTGSETITAPHAAFKSFENDGATPPVSTIAALYLGNATADGPLLKLMDTGGTARGTVSIENSTAKTLLTPTHGLKVVGNQEVTGTTFFGLTSTTDTGTYGGAYIAGDVSAGSGNSYAQMLIVHNSNTNHGLIIREMNVDGGNAVQFLNSAAAIVGSITTSATATAYNTSSDYRLKEDDVPMTGATERVKALRPINFAWKVDGSRVDGFFAHEAGEVVPECVTGTKDAMRDEEYEVSAAVEEVRDEDDNVTTEAVEAVTGTRSVPDMQGIDQSKLVPLLVSALQEAITKIESLTARITTLEG